MAIDRDVEVWATAISTHSVNGRKVIFRYAKEFDAAFDKRSKPNRIILAWTYQSETGQPVYEEHQQMNLMEDLLGTILYGDHFATLALVSTGENLREWTYYAKSEDEFVERLNAAFNDTPGFPIEIHAAFDPDWDMYEEFAAGVKESTT